MNSHTEKEGRKERGTIQGQFNRAAAAWNMISGQEYHSWVIEFQDIFPRKARCSYFSN